MWSTLVDYDHERIRAEDHDQRGKVAGQAPSRRAEAHQRLDQVAARQSASARRGQAVGTTDSYRIRVGNYHVYTIDDGELVIVVVRIGHRREVYTRRAIPSARRRPSCPS
ncbi:type II toxin-antitoxin system RelE/ParE family toxin [Gordonia polyisoprenivorans]|nr:type II toxin-antitoxin system RelE/ParE family toxin [uncultured Gordonia sp.]MBE7193818.1 type II toxin-antitoxin system RelE/ParE family toxin [Gordonia polyisoprenivorans]UZF57157.1 type II toxin-antitoxin system RelE/ParE family toxin [Gordonia polyisoprenivorans]